MAYLVRVDVKLGGEFRQSLVFAKRGQNDLGLESVIKHPAGALRCRVDAFLAACGLEVLFFAFDSFF